MTVVMTGCCLYVVLAMMIRFSPQLQVSHWVQCNSHEEEIQFKFNQRKIYRSRLLIMKSWCEFRSFIDTNLFNSHYRPATVTPESHYHKPWKTWLGLKLQQHLKNSLRTPPWYVVNVGAGQEASPRPLVRAAWCGLAWSAGWRRSAASCRSPSSSAPSAPHRDKCRRSEYSLGHRRCFTLYLHWKCFM